MKNPMTLAVIGSAVISILLGIAGANYEPKENALGLKDAEQTEAASTEAPAAEGDAAASAESATAPAAQ